MIKLRDGRGSILSYSMPTSGLNVMACAILDYVILKSNQMSNMRGAIVAYDDCDVDKNYTRFHTSGRISPQLHAFSQKW